MALLYEIANRLDFLSILNLSTTSHSFRRLFFPLAGFISSFRPITTKDYIPKRLTPPAPMSFLPNELTVQIMMFCDFESLHSLSCKGRHFRSLPPWEWFQVKILELELVSLDPRRQKTYLNEVSSKRLIVCRFPCDTCLQAFHRYQFSFIFWDEAYDPGRLKSMRQDLQDMLPTGSGD
jgi:hypothetical protein